MGYLAKKGVTPDGAPFSLYHSFGKEVELEAGFPVLEELPGDNEGGIVTLPGGRAAIHRAMQATANVGWLYDDIINVNLPTHIIWGQDDKLIPTKLAPRLHKDIRGSTLDVIPYCGHSPMTEKPDRFAKSVLRFFGEPR